MPYIPLRPVRIEGDIAYVPVAGGYEAIIDAQDVERVRQHNWHSEVKNGIVYAIRSAKAREGLNRKRLYMHREIMDAPKDREVDHINGNGIDNRRSNLRLATHAQNQKNLRLRHDNTSGCKGVSLCRQTNRWRAVIRNDGKIHHLGRFDSVGEAARAYAAASEKLHGEFGRLA